LPDETPDQVKDEGVRGIEAFYWEVCPIVFPEQVQLRREIEFENSPIKFAGVIDTLEKIGVISDTKTTGKSWSIGDEYKKLQPPAYSLLLDRNNDRDRDFRFDILVRTRKPKIQQVRLTITPFERQTFLRYLSTLINRIQNTIKTGDFLPRRDHFLCSKKYCGYWEICQKVWGFRIKD
jgi:hypothetical protein